MCLLSICLSKIKGMKYIQILKECIHASVDAFVEVKGDNLFFQSIVMYSDAVFT